MVENYSVGQILYIIPAQSASVIPVCVVERRTSETTAGIKTTHIVKDTQPKSTSLILESIKGTIYSDIKVVRETMIKNATLAVDKLIKDATALATTTFAQNVESTVKQIDEELTADEQFGDFVEIMDANGSKHNVKVRAG